MKITTATGNPIDFEADALIIPIASGGGELDLASLPDGLDAAFGGVLAQLAADARFTGKPSATLTIPSFDKIRAGYVVLAGIGSSDAIDAEHVRKAYGAAIRQAAGHGAEDVVAIAPQGDDARRLLAAAVEGALLAGYRYDKHHGSARANDPAPRSVSSVTIIGGPESASDAIALGEAMARGVALARDLVNEPACHLNPVTFAAEAERVAEEEGLECRVFGPTELEEMGAGGIVNVGKGSANEPRMIHLVYRPESATDATKQIGLVGKCITFDTGGYSIKPYEGMLEMKGDMAGGAAVLGAMSALRAAECPHVVHAVICAAENMISDRAFRPGDILTAMNGVTMEILSTDAEGRLVLADGLVYAARQGAQELIDLATLTGAIVVALGEGTAGLFCNDDDLAERLQSAAAAAGERVWRMPLIEALEEQIKGDIGDIKNTGGRQGGAVTAALFLQHFSEGLPWAHLDIAGCSRSSKGGPYSVKGATGWGVRTLVEYVTRS